MNETVGTPIPRIEWFYDPHGLRRREIHQTEYLPSIDRNGGEEGFFTFHETDNSEPRGTIVFFPDHDEIYGGNLVRPGVEDPYEKQSVVNRWMEKGYNVITFSYPEDVNDDPSVFRFIEHLNTVVEEVGIDSPIHYIGHSFGGMFLEENSVFLNLGEKDDIYLLSSPMGQDGLSLISQVAMTPPIREKILKREGLETDESHEKRLMYMERPMQIVAGKVIARLHQPGDLYIKRTLGEPYTSYDEIGAIPRRYREFGHLAGKHNFTIFIPEIIEHFQSQAV